MDISNDTMQILSLLMYALVIANMVRLWITFKILRQEIDDVFIWAREIHHHMGLCDCPTDATVLVIPVPQFKDLDSEPKKTNSERIREWDESD
jgi:hypothetical protein